MSIPFIWLQLAFYAFGGLLLIIALAHSVTAWRYGARMPLTAITNGLFLLGLAVIIIYAWTALSVVDWSGAYTLSLPAIHFGF